MASNNELIVSATDAKELAFIVNDGCRSTVETEAASVLADVLVDARVVPHERLPGDRVAMNSRVAYREEPNGRLRTVALVHPGRANASEGTISVLSPVGRALLGRKRGAVASIDVPGGRALTVRVLEVERPPFTEAA